MRSPARSAQTASRYDFDNAILDERKAVAERVVRLPGLGQELTPTQRHSLGRVAVHAWTHQDAIPFVAPNAHQSAVALRLAAPASVS